MEVANNVNSYFFSGKELSPLIISVLLIEQSRLLSASHPSLSLSEKKPKSSIQDLTVICLCCQGHFPHSFFRKLSLPPWTISLWLWFQVPAPTPQLSQKGLFRVPEWRHVSCASDALNRGHEQGKTGSEFSQPVSKPDHTVFALSSCSCHTHCPAFHSSVAGFYLSSSISTQAVPEPPVSVE